MTSLPISVFSGADYNKTTEGTQADFGSIGLYRLAPDGKSS